jgi:26S proteasome regulatory subunit N11
MSEYEQQVLMSLNRPTWSNGFETPSFVQKDREDMQRIKQMAQCAENYRRGIIDEEQMTTSELIARHVGKIDPQSFIRENAAVLAEKSATQMIRLHLDQSAF